MATFERIDVRPVDKVVERNDFDCVAVELEGLLARRQLGGAYGSRFSLNEAMGSSCSERYLTL